MLCAAPSIAAPPATGVFDRIRLEDGLLTVWGWALHPQTRRKRTRILLDGRDVGLAENVRREDVKTEYPWIAHADDSGFKFQREWPRSQGRVDLVGESDGGAVFRFSSFFFSNLESRAPTPPLKLAERVAGLGGTVFKIQGLKIFTDFFDQIMRCCPPHESWRMLDWGCGCGRVTAHFISSFPSRVVGADLDSEAISWCREKFGAARFDAVSSRPPLPYEENGFDAVTACSVFTHISRDDQEIWLEEMARVLKPGGVLLATTHGQFAYRQHVFSRRRNRIFGARLPWLGPKPILSGFLDSGADSALDGVAPRDYYRTVYQSRDYTLEAWSKQFEIVDYIERGINGFQDLVVMRSLGVR